MKRGKKIKKREKKVEKAMKIILAYKLQMQLENILLNENH